MESFVPDSLHLWLFYFHVLFYNLAAQLLSLSLSLSLGCQVGFAATEVYFISSHLSHFICHPASRSSDGALLQLLPHIYAFHLLPLTPLCSPLSVFISPSLTLISSSSVFLHLSLLWSPILSKTEPPFTFQMPRFCPFFFGSLSEGQCERATHNPVVLRHRHTPRPQKPSSKMASPQKKLL